MVTKKASHRLFSLVLVLALAVSSIAYAPSADAAKKAKLKKTKATIYVGKTTKITIKNKKSKCTYTFTSSKKKIAKVSKKGVVTGLKAGKAKITVKQTWKKKAYKKKYGKRTTKVGTFTVTVKKKVSKAKATPTATPDTRTREERSLVSAGNNYRMKNAIEKMKNGDDVTVAYIGGSITEGAGSGILANSYVRKSVSFLKETYGVGEGTTKGSNISYVNAGIQGTPSSLGCIRYKKDVLLQYGKKTEEVYPDIVFVEFAVNDDADVTKGEAYESMVRDILKQPNAPAVVLVFSVFRDGQWNLQDRYIPVGKKYNLPMISIKNAIIPEINSGKITNDDFFSSDGLHPNIAGHQIMADCINYLFKTVDKQTKATTDISIPSTTVIRNSYEGIQMIDKTTTSSDYTVTPGDFSSKDTGLISNPYPLPDGRKILSNNWSHNVSNGTTCFTLTVTSKNLLMVYKQNKTDEMGKADIYVDNRKVQTLDGYNTNGYSNPVTVSLYKNSTAAQHKIEVKMAAGSENKLFSILAFGYTK